MKTAKGFQITDDRHEAVLRLSSFGQRNKIDSSETMRNKQRKEEMHEQNDRKALGNIFAEVTNSKRTRENDAKSVALESHSPKRKRKKCVSRCVPATCMKW